MKTSTVHRRRTHLHHHHRHHRCRLWPEWTTDSIAAKTRAPESRKASGYAATEAAGHFLRRFVPMGRRVHSVGHGRRFGRRPPFSKATIRVRTQTMGFARMVGRRQKRFTRRLWSSPKAYGHTCVASSLIGNTIAPICILPSHHLHSRSQVRLRFGVDLNGC